MNTHMGILDNFVSVTFLEDLVALENNETFYLKLKLKENFMAPATGLNVLFCDTIKLTIKDSDSKYFMISL